MERSVVRKLPDGSVRRVEPYHVCVKGLEDAVLCRDAEDYDVMVKTLAVCAWRNNVIIITYNVVSNHSHTAVLSLRQEEAKAFGEDCKKVYSMYFRRKYNEEGVLRRVKVKALWLDNPCYLRNTLAYIPRNALDNGCDIADYPWSGHRAMFRRDYSICDHAYLEQAFDGDPAFYLRIIGSLNVAEMRYLLEEKPYIRLPDSEFYKMVEEVSERWFKTGLSTLSLERKIRLLPYIYRTSKTTIPQLARVFGLSRDRVASILGKSK